MIKIGFQGEHGAYSEQAAIDYCDCETIGFETFEDVFNALKDRSIDKAVVPIENTIAGTVVENFDLLLQEHVFVIAEVMLGIHHNLLAIKGSSLGGITEAYSHPHALNQCKSFLKKHHIRPSVAYDTAGSAMRVSQKKDNTKAAIASKLCAKIYDLDIIKENIESNKTNTTRFFVVVNEGDQSVVSADKTSIAFKTRHYPGALADCLKAFQLHKLNLTKLESRPIPENPFEYVFYTDFEGGINDSVVIHAIKILENHSEFVKVLGSYKKYQ